MSRSSLPELTHYTHAPSTKADLEYADLPIVDFSKISTYEDRLEQSARVRNAMQEHGFLYVINHGYTSAQTQRMFDVADVAFSQVSDEEKQSFSGSMKETGVYEGYKPRSYWHISNGVRDQSEQYNINPNVHRAQHPKALQPFLPEIAELAKHTHLEVVYPLFRLLALGLELPEDTFVEGHKFEQAEGYIRFIKYYPRSEDDEAKTDGVWMKGHTDFGTLTILYSQPVAALQIQTRKGEWKWVRHIDNALVVNSGDALEFLSGGLYKATIHKVFQPPEDQRGHTRLGVFYFCMGNNDLKLAPLADSPVLQRVGIQRRFEDKDAPTAETWRKGRTMAYGQTELKPGAEKGTEEEVIAGVVVKHYI